MAKYISATDSVSQLYIQDIAYILQNKDREKLEALGGIQGLAKALSTSTSDGITLSPQGDLSLEHRQRIFGANAFKEVQQKAFLTLLLGNLKDPTLILLMVAALVIYQYCWNHCVSLIIGSCLTLSYTSFVACSSLTFWCHCAGIHSTWSCNQRGA